MVYILTPLVLNDASPSKQHDLHQNRVNMSQLPIVMCCRVLYAVYCCPRDDAAVCLPRDLACLPACARLPVLPITPHGVVSYCVLMQDVVHMHEIMKGIQPHISKIPKEGS